MTTTAATPDPDLPAALAAPVAEWVALEEVAQAKGIGRHADGILAACRHDAVVHEVARLRAEIANLRRLDFTGDPISDAERDTIETRIGVRVELEALTTATNLLTRDLVRLEEQQREEPTP